MLRNEDIDPLQSHGISYGFGQAAKMAQAAFKVEAPSLSEAVRQAEADFCRQEHVHDWTIFADAVEFRTPSASVACRQHP
jgi:hypothetical protein